MPRQLPSIGEQPLASSHRFCVAPRGIAVNPMTNVLSPRVYAAVLKPLRRRTVSCHSISSSHCFLGAYFTVSSGQSLDLKSVPVIFSCANRKTLLSREWTLYVCAQQDVVVFSVPYVLSFKVNSNHRVLSRVSFMSTCPMHIVRAQNERANSDIT